MTKNKTTNCSICNEPIKTVRGALQLKNAPLVCRRCFGEQSYAASPRWTFSPAGPEASPGS